MFISKVTIFNFKSYDNSGELDLKSGFNVLTGQNSAGKTAMLEALTLRFDAKPHRSLRTVPNPGFGGAEGSSVRIQFTITRSEFALFLRGGNRYIPSPVRGFGIPHFGAYDASQAANTALMDWLSHQEQFLISVTVTRAPGGSQSWTNGALDLFPSLGTTPGESTRPFTVFSVSEGGDFINASGASVPLQSVDGLNSCNYLAQMLSSKVYRFSAERFNMGISRFGSDPTLAANAQNLPEVLNILQHNTVRFSNFNRLVHQILPQIQHVSVRPTDTNVGISIWPHDPISEREDLTVPLNECGSGVGQVLAILYIVLTANQPQVIIVDEPQSFLHPGAVRKLIEVLKQFPQHQYILATHSPTVIAACDPANIVVIRLNEGVSSLQTISASNTNDLSLYLAEIGARLSDVFGADKILWVEGQTEEQCYPRILTRIAGQMLMGTAILGIKQTGDLEGRDARRIFALYRRLSGSNSLLPPAVAFVLDRECRTEDEIRELITSSGNLAAFLPRRMFENYLLNAVAIATLLNEVDSEAAAPISADEVERLIDEKRQIPRYFCGGQIPPNWIQEIDGARVLKDILEELSEYRMTYEKVKHGTKLTDWLIKNDRGALAQLSDFLANLVRDPLPPPTAAGLAE